jgi:hypothetical protein
MLDRPRDQKAMFGQCGGPQFLELAERKSQCISLGEYEQVVARNQVWIDGSDELAEASFGPIALDRIAKSPADDDSNLTHRILRPAREQIETLRGAATPVPLHLFNIPTDSQEHSASSGL